jgi:hypothetical protein
MGRSYLFECSKCGYKAKVSGGEDRGLEFSVQTIACLDCRMLYDAIVRLRIPDSGLKPFSDFQRLRLRKSESEIAPPFESVLNRLPLVGVEKFKWVKFKIRCPVSPMHRVQPWKDPGKCPRCGAFMENNALPFRFWE